MPDSHTSVAYYNDAVINGALLADILYALHSGVSSYIEGTLWGNVETVESTTDAEETVTLRTVVISGVSFTPTTTALRKNVTCLGIVHLRLHTPHALSLKETRYLQAPEQGSPRLLLLVTENTQEVGTNAVTYALYQSSKAIESSTVPLKIDNLVQTGAAYANVVSSMVRYASAVPSAPRPHLQEKGELDEYVQGLASSQRANLASQEHRVADLWSSVVTQKYELAERLERIDLLKREIEERRRALGVNVDSS